MAIQRKTNFCSAVAGNDIKDMILNSALKCGQFFW